MPFGIKRHCIIFVRFFFSGDHFTLTHAQHRAVSGSVHISVGEKHNALHNTKYLLFEDASNTT